MRLFRKPADDLAWFVCGTCIIVYLVSAALSMVAAPDVETPVQYVFEPSLDTLIDMGIGGSLPLHQGHLWTLITSTYLHSDIIHILMNVLCLLAFFPIVSQQFGKAKTFAIYTIAGISGSLLSATLNEVYSLGASGGVFGLYGAMIAYGLRGKHPARWTPVKEELLWVIANFAFGLTIAQNISNAGHFGGLMGGCVAGLALGPAEDDASPFSKSAAALGFVALTALSIAISLFNGGHIAYLAANDRPAYDALIEQRRYAELDENIRQSPQAIQPRLDRSLRRYWTGDQVGAIADIDAVIDLDPSVENLNQKASILSGFQRDDEAIDVYTDILKIEPENASALFYRADALSRIGTREAANDDYRQLIKTDPHDASGYMMRGTAYHVLGDLDNALSDYNQSLDLDDKVASVFVNRAGIYVAKNNFKAALADFDEALKRDPDDMSTYALRAEAYANVGEYQNAIDDYSSIIEKGSQDARVWNGRAWGFFKLGQLDKGLADVEKSLTFNPGYAAALDTRAHIFEAKGERDKAIADYRAALAKDPSITISREALNRMGVQ